MITKEYIFSGIVQGMGFRPTALRLATELGITGTVCNTGGRVTLTATGEGAALTVFAKRLSRAFSIYQGTAVPAISWLYHYPQPWCPGSAFSAPGPGHLSGLRAGVAGSQEPALSAPIHHLYSLRAAVHGYGGLAL